MPVKPYAARHTTEDFGDTLEITIPSQKLWFQVLSVSLWFGIWLLSEIFLLIVMRNPQFQVFNILMIAWLGIWTLSGAIAIYILLWQFTGKEVIEVSNQALTINRVISGFSSPKEYSAEYISGLRISAAVNVNPMVGWSRTWQLYGMSGGLLSFDYGAKTISFGLGIQEAEARKILEEICQRFPQYRS